METEKKGIRLGKINREEPSEEVEKGMKKMSKQTKKQNRKIYGKMKYGFFFDNIALKLEEPRADGHEKDEEACPE